MKRFISIWAAIAMIFSFYACDGDKNYTPRNSDTEINRPDDNEGDSDDTGGGDTKRDQKTFLRLFRCCLDGYIGNTQRQAQNFLYLLI